MTQRHLVLTCLDCGDRVPVSRRDAKYCPKCRLRRGLQYVEEGQTKMRVERKCQSCTQPYRMVHARDWKVCGACKTSHSSTVELLTLLECIWCGERVATTSPLANICLGCQSSPSKRDKLLLNLVVGKAKRVKENMPLLEAIAAGGPHIDNLEEASLCPA